MPKNARTCLAWSSRDFGPEGERSSLRKHEASSWLLKQETGSPSDRTYLGLQAFPVHFGGPISGIHRLCDRYRLCGSIQRLVGRFLVTRPVNRSGLERVQARLSSSQAVGSWYICCPSPLTPLGSLPRPLICSASIRTRWQVGKVRVASSV
jgi:hypothetical protein